MKNIHILPTDKPSRLYKHLGRELKHTVRYFEQKGLLCINQNIYITSDEEIKMDDWCYQVELNDGKVDKCYDVTLYHTWTNNGVDKTRKFKKIILTTDIDLIKDGVQAIDDKFLEWFIKNPSCEWVEIKKTFNKSVWDFKEKSDKLEYKIIIPKEEPNYNMKKEILIEMMSQDEELGLYDEPKQETKELNPYIEFFLRINGFSSAIENQYSTLDCTVIVAKDYYEIQFLEHGLEVSMYTDSHSIYHLVGILTWFNLIDKNYKK
jgi:hypothetical protein